MKLNKTGMTLVELIISIALLSVVLGFLFKILLDVKYENEQAGYAISNQVNRAEIIRTIQEDILEYGINSEISPSTTDTLVLIWFQNEALGIIEISSDKTTLTYTREKEEYNEYGELEVKTDKKTWKIKDKNYKFGIPKEEVENDCYFKIIIPVENGVTDSIIDDIEITGKYGWC